MNIVMRSLLLLVALLAAGLPLSAQEPTPGQLRAAERLVAAMQMESSLVPLREQIMAGVHGAAPDTSRIAAESRTRMRETVERNLTWEKVGPEYVRLYASLYTEEELRQLTAFYESPVGQKSLRLQPVVLARLLEMHQRLIAAGPS